jgi:DNA-directed RNA polymerase subunit beta'
MGNASKRKSAEIDAVRLSLASAADVLAWSHGEVTSPATCTPRTGRPVRGGLFCESIFGPVRDWRCQCGRHAGVRARNTTCPDCGTTILHRRARRQRMGHIDLAAPVVHVWFRKARPSPLATLLGVAPGQVEKVVLGQADLVLWAGDAPVAVGQVISLERSRELQARFGAGFKAGTGAEAIRHLLGGIDLEATARRLRARLSTADPALVRRLVRRLRVVEALRRSGGIERLVLERIPVIPPTLRPMVRLASGKFATSELNDLYSRVIRRNSRLKRLLELDAPASILRQEKRLLQLAVDALFDNQRSPRRVLGALGRPARSLSDLLGGKHGRFRANLLGKRVDYSARAVIVVGPELQLHQVGLPRSIALTLYEPFLVRQLLRHGHARTVRKGQQVLHELAHPALLERTARLIVRELGHSLALEHAGRVFEADHLHVAELDRPRALRNARDIVKEFGSPAARRRRAHLFQEFGPGELVERATRVLREQGPAAARRWVLRMLRARQERVWALVEETTRHHPVLLNRAPTLHRMGIQAFEPVLIEGNAIRLHPLVCKAFNADFDGDQMAVHLPLSLEARVEASVLMMAPYNLFNPASGQLIVAPSQDIVMGCHYLTTALPRPGEVEVRPEPSPQASELAGGRSTVPPPAQFTPPATTGGEGAVFGSAAEVRLAHALGKVGTHARIRLRLEEGRRVVEEGREDEPATPGAGRRIDTTVGRALFDDLLPPQLPFHNLPLTARRLSRLLAECHGRLGPRATLELLEGIKRAGFAAATRSGLSFATDDLPRPADKGAILEATRKKVEGLRAAYRSGNLGSDEYALRLLDLWSQAHKRVTARLLPDLRQDTRNGRPYLNPLFVQVDSGARGNLDQLRQLAGMRGLMASVSGRVIERSITASLREGLPSWDYFLSAHGARKGLTDKGVRTAEAGYLTRKLIDAAQRVVVTAPSCFTPRGIAKRGRGAALAALIQGRVSREAIRNAGGDVIVHQNGLISPEQARQIGSLGLTEVWVRSPLTCEAAAGVCRLCYGLDLGTGRLVEEGTAVGVVAAQSIGEPGTQLTLHTFRLGGLAGKDIVNDLERVTRLLEASSPADRAVLAPRSGVLSVSGEGEATTAVIEGTGGDASVPLAGKALVVRAGERVEAGARLTAGEADPVELLGLAGVDAVQEHLLSEVRGVYRRHGLEIDDRHFEVILARLLGFVRVQDAGDTELLPGQVLERGAFQAVSRRAQMGGGRPATGQAHLLGLTRVAEGAGGFLAAASFQRAVAVLAEAALAGRVDTLAGLKENVMLGQLIPAGTGQRRLREAEVRERVGQPFKADGRGAASGSKA